MKKINLKEKIVQLPQNPGVYFFYGENKELLYIGKATNLRSRVRSYFGPNLRRGEWIERMVTLIADIRFEQTDSVLEALILESNLIKKYQPKYNTMEKDDKSFAYFVITKEEFPRALIYRKTDIDFEKLEAKSQKLKAIFGPYTSKMQMEIALKLIRRIFPFHALKQKSEKGCLDFQIGRCPGPYAGAITKEDYKKNIRGIRMILEGKKKRLISTLEKEMRVAAKMHEFEKAADLRNKIFALQHIHDIALMKRDFENENLEAKSYQLEAIRIEAYDISNISGQHAVGSMVVFENDHPDKSQYRKFKIKTVEGSNDVGMMEEVLSRRFHNDWPMPDLILLDGGAGHLNMAHKLLHEEMGLAVNIASVAKGPTRKKLDVRTEFIQNTNYNIQDTTEIVSGDNKKNVHDILRNDLLLKSIMDEAHRFAITFHRQRRKKNMLS